MSDKCTYKDCKREGAVIYLDHQLCDKHWDKICEMDDKKAKAILGIKEKK